MKKIRFNKKLWSKFLNERMYAWDLVFTDNEGEQKVFRSVRCEPIHSYFDDYGENKPIPDVSTSASIEIKLEFIQMSETSRFLKARRLCRMDDRYSISYRLRNKVFIK